MFATMHRIKSMRLRVHIGLLKDLGANCGQITPGVAAHSRSASPTGYTGRKSPHDRFHGMEEEPSKISSENQ
jgi:hypothetical protein